MVKGKMVKVTTDEAYYEKCSTEVLYVDYKNITKVVTPGSRIFVDDGLISLVAKNIGNTEICFVPIHFFYIFVVYLFYIA